MSAAAQRPQKARVRTRNASYRHAERVIDRKTSQMEQSELVMGNGMRRLARPESVAQTTRTLRVDAHVETVEVAGSQGWMRTHSQSAMRLAGAFCGSWQTLA